MKHNKKATPESNQLRTRRKSHHMPSQKHTENGAQTEQFKLKDIAVALRHWQTVISAIQLANNNQAEYRSSLAVGERACRNGLKLDTTALHHVIKVSSLVICFKNATHNI